MPRELLEVLGLIITEGVEVSHKASSAYPNVPRLDSEKARNAWKKVVEAIKKQNGSVVAQLWHCGGFRKAGMGPDPEVPGHTASGLVWPSKELVLQLSWTCISLFLQASIQYTEHGAALKVLHLKELILYPAWLFD